MEDSSKWEFKRHRAFTSETAPEDGQYVSGIVADNHMTMGISLPEHLDIQTIWASSTPTILMPPGRTGWCISLLNRPRYNPRWI